MAAKKQPPSFKFSVQTKDIFGCRSGSVILRGVEILTPGLLVNTSRGAVPHLSRDHMASTEAIRWVDIPFETFLERNPPLPTIYHGSHPMHELSGFSPRKHIVSMSARDPSDTQEMPANGKDHMNLRCIRGVKKLSPSIWKTHVLACNPDFVTALSDTPFTPPPYSQKRLTKSIERSAIWLSNMIRPLPDAEAPLNVLVQMAGGTNELARQSFSESLVETLHGLDADAVKPLATLDDGICGYVFDLAPLRQSSVNLNLQSLFRSSLAPLPQSKLRVVNTATSPHEILDLISDIGIDIFDSHWAQQAANYGVALDFQFPVESSSQTELGHNLYSDRFTNDFTCFSTAFPGGLTHGGGRYCPCAGCSPVSPTSQLRHSTLDEDLVSPNSSYEPPYTRAYVHHLLHTHEMSAHALLAMHNLSILDAFFKDVRKVISERGPDGFREEIARFKSTYAEPGNLLEEAKKGWKEVDLARGKGRLAREKEKGL